MNYEFTLKFQVSDRHDIDGLLERLVSHGCDDALVGIGQPGRLALSFVREASSADDAIRSALFDVQRAVPTANLIEATPDLVGLTDVAELIGVSRQNMRKLMLVHSIDFPPPVHHGRTCLWHLADILAWLQKRGTCPVRQNVVELAHSAMVINICTAYERVFGAVKPAS
ncbi:helix-turn-helix transcriptional regulator [Pseudomonas sp. xss_4]|uniref:helix-turn-helix transcriptional regulator n=1 Tax=Pseudomonas sp. xss_4 TaxID=3367216 RepID=UPI00370BA243